MDHQFFLPQCSGGHVPHLMNRMIQTMRQRHDQVYVIVSPPRCSSTAFARVFWEQTAVRYYSHEPFEVVYYRGHSLSHVQQKLDDALDLHHIRHSPPVTGGNHLVIKEMPYQVGQYFPLLAKIATKPLIFLIRDPRLNIASRMEQKRLVGDNPIFPHIETGWELLQSQVEFCQEHHIPHIIVDATDFRNHPLTIFPKIFSRFNVEFSPKMLVWRPCTEIELDNLDGQHHHLYERVLQSCSLLPAIEPVLPIEAFPQVNGFRQHVYTCLQRYQALRESPARTWMLSSQT